MSLSHDLRHWRRADLIEERFWVWTSTICEEKTCVTANGFIIDYEFRCSVECALVMQHSAKRVTDNGIDVIQVIIDASKTSAMIKLQTSEHIVACYSVVQQKAMSTVMATIDSMSTTQHYQQPFCHWSIEQETYWNFGRRSAVRISFRIGLAYRDTYFIKKNSSAVRR